GTGRFGYAFARLAGLELVEPVKRIINGFLWNILVRVLIIQALLNNEVTGSPSKHHQVQQRVGTQAIGAVYRGSRTLTDRVQAIDDSVFTVDTVKNLAVNGGRQTTHLVVDRG